VLSWCLLERSWLLVDQADHQQALRDARAALAGLTPPRPDQRMIVIIARIAVGDALGLAGKPKQAVREYREVLTELERIGRGKSRTALWVLSHHALLLLRVGEVSEAGRLLERAVRIEEQYSETRPSFQNHSDLGWQLIEIGKPAQSIALLERARNTARAAGYPVHAALATLYQATARCRVDAASCDAALAIARDEMTAAVPADHGSFGVLETVRAEQALAHGDPDTARAALARALVIFDAANERGASSVKALALLARAEAQLGERESATTHAARAVSRARELMQDLEHSSWLGIALAAQGSVQHAAGVSAHARTSWQQALTELQATLGARAPATLEVQQLLAR
jgi:tetratricopeptide (TPR) repeat protein